MTHPNVSLSAAPAPGEVVSRPETDAAHALAELRRYLTSGAAQDSEKLPTERALAETLGVGRHALRRALDVLEAEGLIWRKHGAGTFLGSAPDPFTGRIASLIPMTNYEEVMEVRVRLEPQIAQLAALRATPERLARLEQILTRLDDIADAEGRELWDGAFHREIAVMAGNQLLLSLFDIVNRARRDKTWQALREKARTQVPYSIADTQRQHRAIVAAIAAADPERAGATMHEHLLDIQMRLLRLTSLMPAAARPPIATSEEQKQ